MLVTALILFAIINDKVQQFRLLGYIIVAIGVLTTLIYILVIREPFLVKEAKRL